MDQVLREEKTKLNEIESRIKKAANESRRIRDSLDEEIVSFRPADYEDVSRKKQLIDRRKMAADDYDRYTAIIPSPYFARLDLDREFGEQYELNSYYIGKTGLILGSEMVIVDWRTPVGECYYAQNQTSFNIEGKAYSLALRRALNIQNSTLLSYKTEYDGNIVSLEGDVIDQFLLTVLHDKRRQNRLTDIIRSIQANQNSIIRQALQKSFIVQGCAGSGKTMILLHRLSYLKFNNRRMNLDVVKIITPNPDFNAHINDLSTELDIDSIERLTVEEYYVSLIKRFSRTSTVTSAVSSETTLNPALLGDIYSLHFVDQLEAQYHQYWKSILDDIDEDRLKESFSRHSLRYPQTQAHNSTTHAALEDGLGRMIGIVEENNKKLQESQIQITSLRAEQQKTTEQYTHSLAEASKLREKMLGTAQANLMIVSARINQLTSEIQPTRDRLQELSSNDGGAVEQIRAIDRDLAELRRDFNNYLDYDVFHDIHDQISSDIAASCSETISRIESLYDQIRRVPVYSFVKRNSLRRQLQDEKTRFTEVAKRHLDSIQEAKEQARIKLSHSNQALQNEMIALSQMIEEADRRIESAKRQENALNECISSLQSSTHLAQRAILAADPQHEMTDYLADYEKYMTDSERQSRRLSEIDMRLQFYENQIKIPQGEDIGYLENCRDKLAKLKAAEIYRLVFRKAVVAAYAKHNMEYTRANYRHKLYLMLLFCSLHYRALSNADQYLNIDEAQDISIAEYKLLRRILGEKCVFNLYGDINQSLFAEKGIVDWDDLKSIIGSDIFVLNENYRNTLQITEYCNREFSAEIYPIGIKGAPVMETDVRHALDWIVEMKRTNPGYRTAIIVHRDTDEIRRLLTDTMNHAEVSWFTADDSKLSVLTVENAKGLEFDAVVAISADMEVNEQYIAYTRALDHLCVVK